MTIRPLLMNPNIRVTKKAGSQMEVEVGTAKTMTAERFLGKTTGRTIKYCQGMNINYQATIKGKRRKYHPMKAMEWLYLNFQTAAGSLMGNMLVMATKTPLCQMAV